MSGTTNDEEKARGRKADCAVMAMQRRDIVRMLSENLASGTGLWTKNWTMEGAPMNAVTRRPYRGVNNVYLTLLAMKRGYKDNRWVTYSQMDKMGWSYKVPEGGVKEVWRLGANVGFFAVKDRSTGRYVDKQTLCEMDVTDRKKYLRSHAYTTRRVYRVYNVELVNGPEKNELPESGRSERAEKMLRYWSENESKIVYGGDDAFYTKRMDTIYVPDRSSFIGYAEFYNTIFHELSHSTAREGRLGRRFYPSGTYGYAMEEMRAEIASLFLSQEFGVKLSGGNLKNNSAYLQSWTDALKENPDAFFDAVYDAEKITKYVLEKEAEADRLLEQKTLVLPSQYLKTLEDEPEKPLSMSDEEIVKRASGERGGDKFSILYSGKQIWADEGRNDDIFFMRLALYTEDREQLKRIYKSSKRATRSDEYLCEKIDSAIGEIKKMKGEGEAKKAPKRGNGSGLTR